jgi:hypothetical protein
VRRARRRSAATDIAIRSRGLRDPGDEASFTIAGDGFSGFTEEQIAFAFFVRFQQQSVPEPSTLLLMALGLGAAGWVARRKRE